LASEANNDLLVYESSTDLWKNKSFATLGLATTGDIPAFATNAEAVAGTSTTTVMTPAANYWADKKSGHSFVQFNSMTAGGSGSGAQAVLSLGGYAVASPSTAVGHGIGSFTFPSAQRGVSRANGSWNWSKAFAASFRFSRNTGVTDTNCIMRMTFGKAAASPGDPTINSVGIRMAGSGPIQLIVHNGTTFTAVTTTSSFVPVVPLTYDFRIISNGAGSVQLYINDVLEATTTAGPTGTSGTANACLVVMESQNTAIVTIGNASFSIYNLHFEFAD
jgi:hypothetical protein